MNKLFILSVDSQPSREHLKWGTIKKLILDNKSYDSEQLYKQQIIIYPFINQIKKIEILIKE
jgi:hypothetical protein